MADPYASFSSPVDQQADPYASFASPVQQQSQPKPVSFLDRANALAAGVNTGITDIAGLPVDTMANIRDLGKAAAGSVVGAINKSDAVPVPQGKAGPFGTGRSFDVDEHGNLVISTTIPAAHIPEFLQLTNRAQDIGSAENIRANVQNVAPGAFDAPRPDDTVSRYLFAGGRGAPAALLSPSRAIPAALSGIAGSEAQQATAEAGGGPLAQTAAGVLGSMLPGGARYTLAEGTKQLARGGEAGRQQTAQNIQDFKNAGTTPSVGQATEGRMARATESLLSRAPGGAGPMAAAAETQGQQMGSKIEQLANQLAPQASGEQAGRAIIRGVSGEGGFVEQFKAKSTDNYNALDKFVPKDAPFVLPKTQAALTELTSNIQGAENTSNFFINSKISAIKSALDSDLQAGNNTLPYEAVKKIRSIVGEQLADAPFNGDVPRSQWKKLYAALSSDLEENAKSAGPQAEAALARANNYHAAGMKRLDAISSVIDKAGGPEKVFQAATSGAKEGATTLRAVMQSLPEDAQKTLSASVLRRIGRATPGRQNDLGERFSTETFLTNWNSMSPQAKAVLFDRYGAGFRQDMDSIAKVASNLREGSAVFKNPSGTSSAVAQTGAIGALLYALAKGDVKTAGAIAGGMGAANLSARVLTNPSAVKWLAKTTKAPTSALPALVQQAQKSSDPDLKELAALLQRQPDNQRDQK